MNADQTGTSPDKPFIKSEARSTQLRLVTNSQPKRDISRVEDYLEAIYHLYEEKGYISVADVSERLGVKPPTVSSMVTKLAADGYVERARYRGMKLTSDGSKLARSVIRRHQTVEEFLSMLGIEGDIAYQDTEGIEHHLHSVTIDKFERLVEFLKRNPDVLQKVRKGIGNN